MTARVRVLVAEDSGTARQLLVEILNNDPEIEVVGEARNGFEAVEMTKRLKPDLVTMDIQMPVMDGLTATRRIMVESATPIVMVSSLDPDDVTASMHSLNAGALAVLAKPVGPGSPQFASQARSFLATVKAMAQVKIVRRWGAETPYSRPAPAAPRPLARGGGAGVVAIAASTGGPAALRAILTSLPGTFPAPILLVQHIAIGFAEGLASWFAATTSLRAKVAVHEERLLPGTIYVAPDDRHLGVLAPGVAAVDAGPAVKGFRPSASYLYESVARVYGAGALCVILTGMGDDGVEGLRVARGHGARVIAQDKASSEIFGMPGAVIEAGLADAVLSLQDICMRLPSLVDAGAGKASG